MAFTQLLQGSFTSDGTGRKILVPSSADYFRVVNYKQIGLNPNPGVGVIFEWFNGVTAADQAIGWSKTNSTNAMNADIITSGGFTYVTTAPVTEAQAPNAITAITAANPAVVTQTNTYAEGDFIRLYNTTGMKQIGGMIFQISSVSGSGYTLLGLPATASNGFAAAGTAGYTRRISKFAAVNPQFLYVTNISQASQAVVSLSFDPTNYLAVGMKLYFSVPNSFGMTQINGLTGKILAINAVSAASNIGAYNVTVDIDSSAFTAFAFPASSLSPTATLFATVAPAGASTQYNPSTMTYTGYNFSLQPFHSSNPTPYMYLAAGANSPAGVSGDQIVWQCYKSETGVDDMSDQ